MDFLLSSVLAQVCLGVGLAQLAGLRAFLPVALLGLFSAHGLFGAPELAGTWFAFLELPWVWIALFAMALVELTLDKLPAVYQAQDLLFTPLRVAAGAAAFGAALAAQPAVVVIVGMVAGAALAAIAHFAKGALYINRQASDGTASAFLSLFLDLVVAAGAVAVLLFPLLGILFLLFLLYFVYRVRKTKRRKKYKGLRLLRE